MDGIKNTDFIPQAMRTQITPHRDKISPPNGKLEEIHNDKFEAKVYVFHRALSLVFVKCYSLLYSNVISQCEAKLLSLKIRVSHRHLSGNRGKTRQRGGLLIGRMDNPQTYLALI